MKINILLVFLRTLSTKQEYIIIARIPKYMYDQKTHMSYLYSFMRTLL